jgi:hypothetical protein
MLNQHLSLSEKRVEAMVAMEVKNRDFLLNRGLFWSA